MAFVWTWAVVVKDPSLRRSRCDLRGRDGGVDALLPPPLRRCRGRVGDGGSGVVVRCDDASSSSFPSSAASAAPSGGTGEKVAAPVPKEQGQMLELVREVSAQRGKGVDTDYRVQVLKLAERLEERPDALPEDLQKFNGLWRLLFTTRPDRASPIQRFVVGSGSIANVFQQLELQPDGTGRFSNIADFRRTPLQGFLSVEAAVLGTEDNGRRLKIRFDNAFFKLFDSKLRVPYPVPFRLLGKKAEGWIDNTVVNDQVRISRGNYGTFFLFERDTSIDDFG